MMYYLDSDYRVHVDRADSAWIGWNDAAGFFDGKCTAFIGGYRVVPKGKTWTSEDGTEIAGLTISPAVDFNLLQAEQACYEGQQQAPQATIAHEPPTPEPPTPEPLAGAVASAPIPDWRQPTKASEAYSIGSVVRYQGDLYQSTVYVNMRPPGEIPGQWVLVGEG